MNKKILMVMVLVLGVLLINGDIYNLNASSKDTSILINELFGGSKKDIFNDVYQTNDGGYLISGSTYSSDGDITSNKGSDDALLVKYDMYGNIEWSKTYGGSSMDEFYSVTEVSDGFIAVGLSSSKDGDFTSSALGQLDGIVVKVDKSGNHIWDKRYGGSLNDKLTSITTTKDGDVVVLGETLQIDPTIINDKANGWQDLLVVKLDKDGNKKWDQVYGGDDFEYAGNVIQTNDGNIVVSGTAYSQYGEFTDVSNGNSDGLLVKLDANTGIPMWDNLYGASSGEEFTSVVENSKGELIATGNSALSPDGEITDSTVGDNDILVVKFDKDGKYIWDQVTGTTGYDESFDVVVDVNDNITTVGYGKGTGGEITDSSNGSMDALIIKIDNNGNLLENDSFGGSVDDEFHSVIFTNDNKEIIVGQTSSNDGEIMDSNNGSVDAMILRDNLGKSDSKPTISGAGDIEVTDLSTFDPKEGVTAEDNEDGDLTDKIEINEKTPRNEGEVHDYVYSVSDSDGNKTIIHRKVTVVPSAISNEKPIIKGANDITIKTGDYINIMEGISATDKEDGDLTSKIMVVYNDLDLSKEGDYTITYSVTDSDLNTTEVSRSIKVIDQDVTIPTKPEEPSDKNGNDKELIETGLGTISLFNFIVIAFSSLILIKKASR